MTLYRGMKRDGGQPLIGQGGLEIRRGVDVDAFEDNDLVGPGGGGLSVTADEPRLLPSYRRPESLGGTSKHPVWSIDRDQLPAHLLSSRPDREAHELIEPTDQVMLTDFEGRVHGTAVDWKLAYD